MSSPEIQNAIRHSFDEASATLQAFLDSPDCLPAVEQFAELAHGTFQGGGQLMSCGNGGSMCDAMHFAEEWNEYHHLLIHESLGGDTKW